MDESKTDGVILKWAHLILVLIVQVLLMGAVWGSLRYQVEEHERRLVIIEKRQEEQFLPRAEFEKRHQELQERVQELRERIREHEMKPHK